MDANEDAEIKAMAGRCTTQNPTLLNTISFQSEIDAGTATFDEHSSVMAVTTADGKVIGSKVVVCPEIGSEFEFEEFFLTVEGARSPLDDVTNHTQQPLSVINHTHQSNPSKVPKHSYPSYQDTNLASESVPEIDCNRKFLVAYTR